MNFLLDTSIVSEWVKPHPNSGVVTWMAEADEDRVFISVLTIAELRHGLERLAPGPRRSRLDEWLQHDLRIRFEDRILPIDAAIADTWGQITAHREAVGRPIHSMDAYIAATAMVHGLTLVSRNDSDFESSVTALINPWSQS